MAAALGLSLERFHDEASTRRVGARAGADGEEVVAAGCEWPRVESGAVVVVDRCGTSVDGCLADVCAECAGLAGGLAKWQPMT